MVFIYFFDRSIAKPEKIYKKYPPPNLVESAECEGGEHWGECALPDERAGSRVLIVTQATPEIFDYAQHSILAAQIFPDAEQGFSSFFNTLQVWRGLLPGILQSHSGFN